MKYTLGQAAKATNRSKGTISGDIKSGKLSAEKLENGSYAIDASELIRVYGEQFNPNHHRLKRADPATCRRSQSSRPVLANRADSYSN